MSAILSIIGILIAMIFMIGIMVLIGGEVMDSVSCDGIDFTSDETGFESLEQCEEVLETTKSNVWLVLAILPIILVISVIRLFFQFDEFDGGFRWFRKKETYTSSGTQTSKETNHLSIGQKILIMLGMAKVTKK